jgi:hypothetical protein
MRLRSIPDHDLEYSVRRGQATRSGHYSHSYTVSDFGSAYHDTYEGPITVPDWSWGTCIHLPHAITLWLAGRAFRTAGSMLEKNAKHMNELKKVLIKLQV